MSLRVSIRVTVLEGMANYLRCFISVRRAKVDLQKKLLVRQLRRSLASRGQTLCVGGTARERATEYRRTAVSVLLLPCE